VWRGHQTFLSEGHISHCAPVRGPDILCHVIFSGYVTFCKINKYFVNTVSSKGNLSYLAKNRKIITKDVRPSDLCAMAYVALGCKRLETPGLNVELCLWPAEQICSIVHHIIKFTDFVWHSLIQFLFVTYHCYTLRKRNTIWHSSSFLYV